jgi:hypothetical protein
MEVVKDLAALKDDAVRQLGPGAERLLLPSGRPDLDAVMSFLETRKVGQPSRLPEVRQLCSERSGRILANHDRLGCILDRHEATIRKRWAKKSRRQRQQILLGAWPDMPAMHRPDFAAFRRESPAQRASGTQFRDRYLWPYVNQEDLLRTKSLLLLLDARGRHPPCDFAAADREAMRLGRVTKAIVPVCLLGYTVTLNGVSGPEYGRLVAWEELKDALHWALIRKQFLAGEASVILEAQDRLMQFLVRCCEQLLQDIPAAELLGDKYPVQTGPVPESGEEPDGFGSLAVMAEEAPYRPPARLDFGRIESLLSARTSTSEDQYVSPVNDDASALG